MSKSLLLAVLALALVCTPVAATAQSSNVTVFVNGQKLTFDQPPVLQNGRVFVPLRGVFQALGASVVYSNGKIAATGSGRTVSLTIGSTSALVNGQVQYLDVAPFTEGDRTLVPLRFVAQALGANVNWDDSSSAVTITSGRAVGPPPRPVGPPPRPVPVTPPVALTASSPNGAIGRQPQPRISFTLNKQAALSAILVTVDGTNANKYLLAQGAKSFYLTLPYTLQPMKHTVRVYGRTQSGTPFDLRWYFTTSP
jgi:Copper amine oxidase N-terminal domain